MSVSTKIFTIIFLILGILLVSLGIFIVLNVSNNNIEYERPEIPIPTVITPTPTTTPPVVTPTVNIEPEIEEGSVIEVSSLVREYNLSVKSRSVTNPLPDLKLIIEPISLSQSLQNEPIKVVLSPAVNPIFDNSKNTWKYKFIWEGFSASSNILVDGAYNLFLESSKTGKINAPLNCTDCDYISVSDDVPNAPVFTISKNSIQTCTQNGDVNIQYTIRVRNIGSQNGQFSSLEDNLDSKFTGTPVAISPQGTYQNKKISWGANTVNSNQFKEFTYSITINNADIPIYQQSGFVNVAELKYGANNTVSFTLKTNLICQSNVITTPTPTPTPTPTQTPTTTILPTPTPNITDIPVSRIPETYVDNKNIFLIIGFGFVLIGFAGYTIRRYKLFFLPKIRLYTGKNKRSNKKNHIFEKRVENKYKAKEGSIYKNK